MQVPVETRKRSGIRGFFQVRTVEGNAFQLIDLGTPESDGTIVQALREMVKESSSRPYLGDRIIYQSWEMENAR